MIRSALIVLVATTLVPLRAVADPPTAYGPAVIDVTVASGDTLDSVLDRAGVPAGIRAEAALALAGVYDLTDLRPGHRVEWTAASGDPTSLTRLSLFVEDGVEIALTFNGQVTAERLEPPIRETDRRETLVLDGTLYEALVARNAPERFAVDLTALLAGQVDFRRDLQGGETFALVWQEDQLPDGSIAGEPRLNYARLELADRVLELVATEAAGPVIVFEDGEAVQRSAAPILGARLSSVFGRRNHPVLGGVRMHTGIDYAAPVGTEVSATGAGRVVFAGTIRGYGLTIDIDHGGGVVTRYAHLSEIAEDVREGTRVKAGDSIGAVGATGLVSGPNLHYEVRVDGRPVDPTDRDALPEQEIASSEDLDALTTWRRETGFEALVVGDRG
ncbi:peptidase M23-like protein [Rhodobacter sp. 140A]|uniref:Membrane protein n=1 Tax=Rubellimicrobium thermophilum DSM 16684 TaxID=1123069 RepID=S9R731_9RHOB|nr:M23 family metallopeptidase [Rubellimicrobium thermophilum]EPX87798.1 Membrane protein [Rubellimicrobium thermophilum DSM 16684]RBP84049.1 peptidase M23-like protein [Rhodobacter sp. 140A]